MNMPDRRPYRPTLPKLATALVLIPAIAPAYEVNDQLEINALVAGAYQCQQIDGDAAQDLCRGGGAFQPEVFYNPTKVDQLFVKLGFGAGNGLNQTSPFVLAPWAADLEDDVKDINGRDRSYLLEAWYAHTFELAPDHSIQLTAGIVDPAFYINENAYANDEYTQFMNEAFVNDRSVFIPAYDWGAAAVWKVKDWTISAVGMNLGENDDGREYNWYALEADYHLETPWGAGNYRLLYAGTSREFLGPEPQTGEEEGSGPAPDPSAPPLYRLQGWSVSYDQGLGPILGAFLRIGFQDEDAAVTYRALYTGGIDIKGAAWGRESDNIGIGLGYLDGGNGEVQRTDVFEAYYRFAVNDHLALTADVQYMEDKYRGGDAVEGWVLGARAVVEF
jgi:porin